MIQKNEVADPELVKLLSMKDPVKLEKVLRMLLEARGKSLVHPLIQILKTQISPEIVYLVTSISFNMTEVNRKPLRAHLLPFLTHSDREIRRPIAVVFGKNRDKAAAEPLLKLLKNAKTLDNINEIVTAIMELSDMDFGYNDGTADGNDWRPTFPINRIAIETFERWIKNNVKE